MSVRLKRGRMGKGSSLVGLVFGVLVCGLIGSVDGRYETGAGIVKGKLNVHLVAHSHDDVGWLKTVDQYFIGSNNSIQNACVQNVLDSVVDALLQDPNRKFVFAEQAFFQRWWETQSERIRAITRNLVNAGQLEFINGGWCMHDEAATHYIDMIDQTTLGHRYIKKQFNKVPRAGWQIDPFGHSAVQGYLLGAEVGFDSVHFARIDYQDRAARKANKSLEVIWQGSKTFGSPSQIFTNAFPVHYSPPSGFHFEVFDEDVPVQDNHLLFDYNVDQRVEDFISAAIAQANVTRGNHVMWTMGDDFQYQFAETWFRQMDKLIHYVNKDSRVNALYSTPSIYTDAKNAENISWPLKTDDYFPYADNLNAYWTGYFTSRPALKRYIRMLSGYFLAARQLEFQTGRRSTGPNTFSLEDALGIAQHHDAVTGTAKQHTTNDYAKRLAIGETEARTVVSSALACLMDKTSQNNCTAVSATFSQCPLLNISYCPPSEQKIQTKKSLVVVAYNSLGWNRTEIIRIPVNTDNNIVQDSAGNVIEAQYITFDNDTSNLRKFYTKAYLGTKPKNVPKYWLVFQGSVPAMGWNTFFVSKSPETGKRRQLYSSRRKDPRSDTVEVGSGNMKLSYSTDSGQLKRVFNSRTGVDVPMEQTYLWYGSSSGGSDVDAQASGAYIFRPTDSDANIISRSVTLKIVRGPLVDEVYQQFSPWISQVTRVYKNKEHIEFEYTVGAIPTDDGIGKEVITKITSNMATDEVFYTDSNGRDFLKRVRNYREDWPLMVTQPVAGNYYPINLGIFTTDNKSELSVLVDRATGGSSIKDGQVELMLHRRILNDDGRGVGEPLDETVCAGQDCKGLTVRGNYYLSIDKLGCGAKWRRTTGQEIYSPLLLAFTHANKEEWSSSHLAKANIMDPEYSLPLNVAIITLQELDDGSVLLRLAHLYEADEDAEYSKPAIVELTKLFAGKKITNLRETSLSANQDKSQMSKKTWKVEGETKSVGHAFRGGPVHGSTLIVELGPMEIRTFLLNFSYKHP
ncbi:hypothetical protein QQ045_017300 [Rhodiola kirilowii]